jgi:hypothetical protein
MAHSIIYVYERLGVNKKGRFVASFTASCNCTALERARALYSKDLFICSYV